jgi:chorismate dehydratase
MPSGTPLALPSEPLRIALVSYLNTYPLVWGLRRLAQAGKPEMVLSPPSQCSALLLSGTVELALVPSITFLTSKTCFEVLPFGIISNREVDTVLLAGNAPMEAWDTIYLDEDSLTSVQLARILVAERKLHPRFVSGLPPLLELGERSGVLMIGNKCFQLAAGFSHCYDLSRLWFELTGLPFVFALVLAHPQLPQGALAEAGRLLQAAVTLGAQHLTEVVDDWMSEHPEEKQLKHKEYYYDYLQHKISYALTPEALAGLRTFYEKTALEFPARKRARLTPEYFGSFDLAGTAASAPPSGANFRQKPR